MKLNLGVVLLILLLSFPAHAKDYKLGIVIVVDQFRADYLMRFKDKFGPHGYRMLMEGGAYFPLADHGLLQNMTGPGHAGILTGSYPYRNGISANFWYDRETKKRVYCMEDLNTRLIGSNGPIANEPGVSPRNLNASTLGDELKNVDRPSRVVSIAMKDRAAILLGGRRTNATLWIEPHTCQWSTSDFFAKEIPAFAKTANQHLQSIKGKPYTWSTNHTEYCAHDAFRTPWVIQETFDLALAAMDEYKLGQGKDTDLLLMSLSSPDYLGHQVGPNDPLMEQMVMEEDKKISELFTAVAKKLPNGMKDVFVVLTGDHGMPPSPKFMEEGKLAVKNIPEATIVQLVEDTLTHEYGKPSGGKWVEHSVELQIYLNQKAVKDAKTNVSKIAEVLRARMLNEPYLDGVWARDDILYERKVPALDLGKIMDRTLSTHSGDILFLLKPYFYSDAVSLTHMTHYSYDRYVPLIFWGREFKTGVYRQIVNVVDIAPTLSSVLHVLPPSQSEGRVITEILR
jgi:predicted AlkP superfamily pyrophosphatase or phosphodiesterase